MLCEVWIRNALHPDMRGLTLKPTHMGMIQVAQCGPRSSPQQRYNSTAQSYVDFPRTCWSAASCMTALPRLSADAGGQLGVEAARKSRRTAAAALVAAAAAAMALSRAWAPPI